MNHWFYISSKGQADLSPKATYFGLPHTYLNIFFSEIIWLFVLKFHMEYSADKMATMPIHGYNKICLNDILKLTLTYFNSIKEIR